MHLSIILDPRADVLHAGKRGGNGRVVPPPAHGCRAGGGEGSSSSALRRRTAYLRRRPRTSHCAPSVETLRTPAAARRHAPLSRRENPLRPHRRLEHVLSGGEAGIEKSVKVRRLDDEKAPGSSSRKPFANDPGRPSAFQNKILLRVDGGDGDGHLLQHLRNDAGGVERGEDRDAVFDRAAADGRAVLAVRAGGDSARVDDVAHEARADQVENFAAALGELAEAAGAGYRFS